MRCCGQQHGRLPGVFPHVGLQRPGTIPSLDFFQQIAQPLRPRDRRCPRRRNELVGVEFLGDFAKNSRYLVETSGIALVASEVNGRGLWRGGKHCATWGIEALHRDGGDVFCTMNATRTAPHTMGRRLFATMT